MGKQLRRFTRQIGKVRPESRHNRLPPAIGIVINLLGVNAVNQSYKRTKIIQYLMLTMLLVLVFLVSAYAGSMRKAGKIGQNKGAAGSTAGQDPGGSGAGDPGQQPSGSKNPQQSDSAQGDSKQGDSKQGNSAQGDSEQGDSKENNPEQENSEQGNSKQGDSEQETSGQAEKGTIVLDAGHGGFDPGVSGASGIAERELNLIFAQKLEKLLTDEGYRVVQTRPTQEGLYDEGQSHKKAQDMQRRCAVIEKEKPLVTVSIHQNSYPDSSVSGPQVFYYAQSKEGERLAGCIQKCMNEQLEVKAPKTHKGNASYYILKRSVGTTVIVECGFLTNPEEEKLLQDEAYQDRAVCAIRDGILQYLDSNL